MLVLRLLPIGLRWVLHGCLIGGFVVIRVRGAAVGSHYGWWEVSLGKILERREPMADSTDGKIKIATTGTIDR